MNQPIDEFSKYWLRSPALFAFVWSNLCFLCVKCCSDLQIDIVLLLQVVRTKRQVFFVVFFFHLVCFLFFLVAVLLISVCLFVYVLFPFCLLSLVVAREFV